MLYWLWVTEIPLCRLLFYLGFLSLAVTIDRAEGKGFEHLYTSLLLPTTHKHLDISWKFCNLDGYLVFLIARYLINKLLLDNTSHTFIISVTYCTAMIRFSTLALCGLMCFSQHRAKRILSSSRVSFLSKSTASKGLALAIMVSTANGLRHMISQSQLSSHGKLR